MSWFWRNKKQKGQSQQRLEGKLRELDQKLETLEREQLLALAVLQSMNEAVIAIDSSQKILFVNQATEQLFGLKQEKVKGKNFLEAIRNTQLNEIMLKTFRESNSQSNQIEMLTPIQRFLKVQTSPLVQQSKTIGVIAVLHDVTQLRQLEQIRKEFVANVSHELKTPLTSIQSAVETLLNGALEDSKHNHKFLQCIEEETKRLGYLIEDLLQLSRIESKEISLKKERIVLEEVLQKAADHFKKALKERNITLALDNPHESLTADPEQLQRAIENLLDNAIKYNKSGGQVQLRAKREEDSLRIEVEDSGIGIPEQDLPRVFERFYRVDKARSRELGGTGLGLSIVKHIAESHGGRVEVTSHLGKGSCFSLVLPQD